MATMRVAQVTRPGGPFQIVERPIPEPEAGSVRVKVQACGVCHSDAIVKDALFPGLQYPRVPGHEVIGTVDSVGAGVTRLAVGQRVGVGWNGGYCGQCDPCRRGEFFACENGATTGISVDGGYAEYLLAHHSAVAVAPPEVAAGDAAPLMCAGVTTFNALRNSGARPGDLVAIYGIGGLGHLGVQFAAKMGFYTVAVARGQEKAALARELGADLYIDSQATDAAAELAKLGGARVILATVTSSEAMSAIQGGLGIGGTLVLIGVVPSMTISPPQMITRSQSVKGWYSGMSIDSQDTLAFAARRGVRSMNEAYPFERVSEAYERMMSSKARFRVVLTMGA
jgi:D-arabinose 1-dehydrogenase-like Zn-dependent alcohol dehydrogenase